MTPKRIVRFSARDVLRLSVVEIEPSGSVITLGGRNGSGKSSCLNAIEMCLAGKRAMPEKPIREGAERAEIVIDLGDIIVERVITESADRLVVRSREGAVYPRPQEMLNKLFASIAFDPLRFASQEAKDQAETLRGLIGLDLSDIDADRQNWFDERTATGRELKKAQARLEGMAAHADAPAEEVSVAALGEELARRQQQVRQRDHLQRSVRTKIDAVTPLMAAVERAKERIAKLEQELLAAHDALDASEHAVEQGKEAARAAKAAADACVVDDPAEVQGQLASAEAVNRKVRENAERTRLAGEVADLEQSVRNFTENIDECDATKLKAISEAKFPVPGLGLADAGVTMNGIPFAQASKAEQLRVSLAVGIAMNPELRVMFVRDGSLLDEDGLRLIAELAEKHDVQLWLEDARTTDPAAVIIEDGHVRGVEPEAAKPAKPKRRLAAVTPEDPPIT